MLKLEHINYKTEEELILKNISMEFKENTKYAILGINGSGKSTLAYIIMGIENYKPIGGKIILNGNNITNLSAYERAKKGISIIFQEPARFEGFDMLNYLTLGGKIKASKEEIENALKMTGLNPDKYFTRKVDENLSGGERKRVELASIILLKPKYIILDEVDSGIDLMSLDKINKLLDYIKNYGGTPIIITHRAEIAKDVDYAYLICKGTILNRGNPKKFVDFFAHNCKNCDHPNKPEKDRMEIKNA